MEEDYEKIISDRKAIPKETKEVFKRLNRVNKKKLDDIFHEEHDAAFEKIDCLKCANCCKTTSPIFRDSDIKKLAKRFKVKPHAFITEYLKTDIDGDYVLRTAPCPFLWDDNSCGVYEDRPLACKEYPHTDRKNMYQVLDLAQKNLDVCPAVCKIIDEIAIKTEPTRGNKHS
jgi:Fe-S-cluster containining protein